MKITYTTIIDNPFFVRDLVIDKAKGQFMFNNLSVLNYCYDHFPEMNKDIEHFREARSAIYKLIKVVDEKYEAGVNKDDKISVLKATISMEANI